MSGQVQRLTEERLARIRNVVTPLREFDDLGSRPVSFCLELLAHIDALNADLSWERAKNKHLLWALKWDEAEADTGGVR